MGVGKARDQGVRLATGTYIMFVDPDDWIESNTVSVCVKAIEKHNADLVEFGYQRRVSFDYNQGHSPIRYRSSLKLILKHGL